MDEENTGESTTAGAPDATAGAGDGAVPRGAEEDFRPRPTLLGLQDVELPADDVPDPAPTPAGEASVEAPDDWKPTATEDRLLEGNAEPRMISAPPVVREVVADPGRLETQSVSGPVSGGAGKWPAGHTTGAFVSAAASFRYGVPGYRWHEIGLSLFVLYGLFVALPALVGAWALLRIGSIVGWW